MENTEAFRRLNELLTRFSLPAAGSEAEEPGATGPGATAPPAAGSVRALPVRAPRRTVQLSALQAAVPLRTGVFE